MKASPARAVNTCTYVLENEMQESTRRQFLAATTTLGAAMAFPAAVGADDGQNTLPPLMHNVYFWLKNPDSLADRNALIAGLRTLAQVPTVRGIHIGVPASTEQRDVVDSSYQVSELLLFDDVEGQNTYQAHPLHIKFVEDCSHLWEKVVVYDSLTL